MHRRSFLLSGALAALARGSNRIQLDRISLLTDEAAKSPEAALAFAREYGLKWVELRGKPGGGGSYCFMEPAELQEVRRQLDEAGLKVSFLNTPMLKYALPGAEPVRRPNIAEDVWKKRLERDAARFEKRMEELEKSVRAARILGVNQIRVFAFTRVAEPESLFPRVAEILKPMADYAREEGMRLLIENEASCNVARTAELAKFFSIMDHNGLGINWDPVNAMHREEPDQFPQAYSLLQKKRIGNVQMKAEGLILGKQILDWGAIFKQLEKDGYNGCIGLETHVFDGTLIEKAHLSMKKIQELVGIRT